MISGAPTGTSASTAPCRVTIRPANGEGISTAAFAVSTSTNGWFSATSRALGDEPLDDPAVLEALAEVRHREDAFHQ